VTKEITVKKEVKQEVKQEVKLKVKETSPVHVTNSNAHRARNLTGPTFRINSSPRVSRRLNAVYLTTGDSMQAYGR
jgi:hypothetical protein